MTFPHDESTATTQRSDRTALGYRRFRCRDCSRVFHERTGTLFNRLPYPTDVVCLVLLWRCRSKLSLRDLAEMFLQAVVNWMREEHAGTSCRTTVDEIEVAIRITHEMEPYAVAAPEDPV